ncbi:hypothetical protein DFH09DRAFT_1335697 [Mycena vulgaris]|nr:hypothetical protein DFH09DRAFT_1335697 [Mycena vulgaris]
MPTRRVYLLLRGAALNAATSSLPLPPLPSTTALSAYASTNPNPKLPPSINYGSSPLSLRPSELSLPEVFSTHRTLAAPAPPPPSPSVPPPLSFHILPNIPVTSSTGHSNYALHARDPLGPLVLNSPRHLPASPDTARHLNLRLPRPLCLLRLSLPSDASWLPIDIRHDFPRHSRPRLSISGATSPPSRRRTTNRPPQAGDIVVHHAIPSADTRHSARAQSKYPTQSHPHPQHAVPSLPARHTVPPPTRTSRLFPPLDSAPRPLFIAGAGLFASPRRFGRSTAAPRSTPRCRLLQRDAQHHSQRQRTPPSFAIASAVDLRGS